VLSNNTHVTTPPSSASFNSNTAMHGTPACGLSYPSVPPPSLSSSFGSPTIAHPMLHRDPSLSPIEPLSRRGSNARRGNFEHWVADSSPHRIVSRGSVERGARIAETGTLVPHSRAGSQGLAPTTEATEGEGEDTGTADHRRSDAS
jgi:coiled-coil domain-containing protein 6